MVQMGKGLSKAKRFMILVTKILILPLKIVYIYRVIALFQTNDSIRANPSYLIVQDHL